MVECECGLLDYEAIVIVEPNRSSEVVEALIGKVKDVISANGVVDNLDFLGKRKTAYPINHFSEAYYVLIDFSASADFPKELARVFRVTDGIMRGVVVKKEKRIAKIESNK